MKKLIIFILAIIIIGGGGFYFIKPQGSKTASSSNFSFSWPTTYKVNVKSVYTDPNTGKQTVNSNIQYLTDGLKVVNTDLNNPNIQTIIRIDQHKTYSLNGATKVYSISLLDPSIVARTDPFDPVGSWSFDKKDPAQNCNRYMITPAQNGTSQSAKSFYVCMNDSGGPVYAEFQSGLTREFSDYSSTAIPADQFEIPAGWTDFGNIPKS